MTRAWASRSLAILRNKNDFALGQFAHPMELITVSRAFNPGQAHLVRSRLEAAGFHAVVTHELAALTMDGYSMAAGGILVQVPDEESAEAKAFLEADDAPEQPPQTQP